MENLWYIEEKKNGLGKGGIIWRRKINGDADQWTDQQGEYKAISLFRKESGKMHRFAIRGDTFVSMENRK